MNIFLYFFIELKTYHLSYSISNQLTKKKMIEGATQDIKPLTIKETKQKEKVHIDNLKT